MMGRSLQWGAQLAGLPSIIGLGARPRSRRRDTWEERCGCSGPSFKASLVSRQQSPRRQRRGSSPSLRGQGSSGIPMGAGMEALSLLHWINPLTGNPSTPRLSGPHDYGGIPKGWSQQPRDQAAPQNQVSADGSQPLQCCGLHFHPKTWVPQRIFTSLSVLPRKSSREGAGWLPMTQGSRCSPAHFLRIWTLAYSEPASSGRGAGRRGALLRCTMSRSA